MIKTTGELVKILMYYPSDTEIYVTGCYASEADIERVEEMDYFKICPTCKTNLGNKKRLKIITDLMTG